MEKSGAGACGAFRISGPVYICNVTAACIKLVAEPGKCILSDFMERDPCVHVLLNKDSSRRQVGGLSHHLRLVPSVQKRAIEGEECVMMRELLSLIVTKVPNTVYALLVPK